MNRKQRERVASWLFEDHISHHRFENHDLTDDVVQKAAEDAIRHASVLADTIHRTSNSSEKVVAQGENARRVAQVRAAHNVLCIAVDMLTLCDEARAITRPSFWDNLKVSEQKEIIKTTVNAPDYNDGAASLMYELWKRKNWIIGPTEFEALSAQLRKLFRIYAHVAYHFVYFLHEEA